MQLKRKMLIVIISYLVAIIALILGTNYYIENKTKKLWLQAHERFDNFFRNQDEFVDTRYTDRSVRYSQTSNPEPKPNIFFFGDSSDLDVWKEKHSDIYKYFRIDSIYNGWSLFFAKKQFSSTMLIYYIYPSYVGYRKQENSYEYKWIPSVETCVNEAYEFWTSNSKSQYFDYYQRGNVNRILDLIRDVPNEYFGWNFNRDRYQIYISEGEIGTRGYMYNGYYKVFIESTKQKTYEIEKRDEVIESDKFHKLIIGGIILTVILLIFLIPMIIQNMRYEKELHEPLYDKLKNLCNPANFMKPYDKKKIDIANSIYEQLIKITSSDIESLKELRTEAIKELDLNFINVEYLQYLKAQCNPEQFLEPYNAEKVRIANEIYQKLIDNENNIDILEEVEKEIKKNLS